MKTVKNTRTGELKRVKDDEADSLTRSSTWSFAPKSEWKEAIRPQSKVVEKKESK